jgi:hypothetical protein
MFISVRVQKVKRCSFLFGGLTILLARQIKNITFLSFDTDQTLLLGR